MKWINLFLYIVGPTNVPQICIIRFAFGWRTRLIIFHIIWTVSKLNGWMADGPAAASEMQLATDDDHVADVEWRFILILF